MTDAERLLDKFGDLHFTRGMNAAQTNQFKDEGNEDAAEWCRKEHFQAICESVRLKVEILKLLEENGK